MVERLYCFPHAGLGNRIFILASTFGMAHAMGVEHIVFANHPAQHYPPNTYDWLIERFAAGGRTVHVMSQSEIEALMNAHGIAVHRETDLGCMRHSLAYEALLAQPGHGVLMLGYFQSERYFRKQEPMLRTMLSEPVYVTEALDRSGVNFASYVAIHVRVGDYLRSPKHYVPLHKYYERAIRMAREQFGDSLQLLLFTNQIDEARLVYPQLFENNTPLTIWQGSREEEDMYAMARCAGVICANSTFSWWGAWLGTKRFVTIPNKWLTDRPDVLDMEGAQIVPV